MLKRSSILYAVVAITGLSGFCSLVYQVVWDRTVKYNFGGDSISSAIVTGTFLLGLGIGAYIFGRWRTDAFKTYALIELLIGVFGIVSFYVIAPVASTLAGLFNAGPEDAEGLRLVVVAGCILLLLPPCTLIGGTLPLMLRCFVQPLNFSARTLGFIYGVNTLGASLGILAVPLFLLNNLSLPTTLAIIGSINISLAALIWFAARKLMPVPVAANAGETSTATGTEELAQAGTEKTSGKNKAAKKAAKKHTHNEAAIATTLPSADGDINFPLWLLWALAFVSGFIAISFEVSLFRAFAVVNPSSAYNFPLVLVFFLLALALGSIVFTRAASDSPAQIIKRLGWLMAAAALAIPFSIWLGAYLHGWWYPVSFMPILDGSDEGSALWVLIFCVVLVMPVPFFTGAIFPLLLRLKAKEESGLADATGRIYLVNSLGSFFGAIGAKFWGFPVLGTEGYISLLFLVSLALGAGILLWRARVEALESGNNTYVMPAGFACVALVLALAMPERIWLAYITGGPEPNWEVKEGVTGVAQIWWEQDYGDVRVNGQYMSRLPHHPRHMKQEMFLLAQPMRERILVLGIGGAGIIQSLAEDPAVSEIYAVDWSYELPGLLSTGRAGELLDHVLISPKVKVIRTDARVAVSLFEPESFDMVFDNLAFASWAGSSSIKSATYYKKIKKLIKPEGMFITGANYYGDNRLGVLASLVNVFDEVHEHPAGEIVIAGEKFPEMNEEWVLALMQERAEALELYNSPEFLLGWFRSGFQHIDSARLGGAAPIRDELLIHEYYWRPFRRG